MNEDEPGDEVPGPGGDAIAAWLVAALAFFVPEFLSIFGGALRRNRRSLRERAVASLFLPPVVGPGVPTPTTSLLSVPERADLADLFAAIQSPSTVIGRLRLHGSAGEVTLPQFENAVRQMKPLRPESAIRYFDSLVPSVGSDPMRFGSDQRRRAFTVAVSSEERMTAVIQHEIAKELSEGRDSTQAIETVIANFGRQPLHRQYSQMVARTNVMEALNVGQQDELSTPRMQQLFPVWQYHAIRDSRVRPWHRARDGRYWPTGIPFSIVRGTDARNVINCRCNWTAIPYRYWQSLQASGERVERAA